MYEVYEVATYLHATFTRGVSRAKEQLVRSGLRSRPDPDSTDLHETFNRVNQGSIHLVLWIIRIHDPDYDH